MLIFRFILIFKVSTRTCLHAFKVQCRIEGDVLAEMEHNLISVFSLVYNHLKIRILMFLLP